MIKIIKDLKEMKAIANEWNNLAMGFHTPLLQHEWLYACAESFCEPGQLFVILNIEQGVITAIAPLILRNNQLNDRLELLGSSFTFEPGGMIFKDEASLKELLKGMIRLGMPMVLGRLYSESFEVSLLKSFRGGKCFLNRAAGSPVLSIKTSWEKFEAEMSSDYRNELRRKRKLLEANGKMNFEMVAPTPDNMGRFLDEMIRLEAAGWKGKEKTALFFDQRLKKFYYQYSEQASRRGDLRVGFLKVDEKPIAAILGVESSNRFWVLKIGYDEAWKKCAPGILLLHESIKYSFGKNLEGFEFLGSEENWIRRWTKQTNVCVIARFYPYTFWGVNGFTWDAFRSIFKKVTGTGN